MISKLLITFLAGILFGFLLHMLVTGGFEGFGGTSVAAVAAAEVQTPPSVPDSLPRVRENDGATGLLLRQFLAERPVQFDAVKSERDAAVAELAQLSKELLLSYGTMDQAGATVGGLLRRIMEFENFDETDVDDAEKRALMKDMVSLVAMSGAIRELDADPAEASLYQSAVLREVGLLSDASTERVRTVLDQVYREAGALGINSAARPDEGFDEWNLQRAAVYGDVYAQLQSHLTPAENEALAAFNESNGFMPWKLIDPFDPAVFLQSDEYTGR